MLSVEEILKDPNNAELCKEDDVESIKTLAQNLNYNTCHPIIDYLERLPVIFAIECIARARQIEHNCAKKLPLEEQKQILANHPKFREWCVKHFEEVQAWADELEKKENKA